MKTIDVVVVQQCHFPRRSIREIGEDIRVRFSPMGAKVHFLAEESAMAIIWSGLATEKGPTEEIRNHTKLIGPVVLHVRSEMDIHARLAAQYDPLPLYLPDWKYRVCIWLRPGEIKGRFIHTGYEKVYNGCSSIVCRLISSRRNDPKTADALKSLVTAWHDSATTTGFGEEDMSGSQIKVMAEDDEFQFEVHGYRPVTFPWIELYLRIRALLPRSRLPRGITYGLLGAPEHSVFLARMGIS